MNVLRLGFENFRNLCPGEIFPGETINVIHGSNAQGKTNLLEAIWLFTGGHSFRGTKDSELPVLKDGKNAPAASLSMTLFTEGREQELRLELRDGRRSSVINGVEKKTGACGQVLRRHFFAGASFARQRRPFAPPCVFRRCVVPVPPGIYARFGAL